MTSASLHTYGPDGRPGLRNWRVLMKPERLAAMQPSRLSGTRAMMNRMIAERWQITCDRFEVDEEARGTIVYSIRTPRQEFSFIAFSLTPKREGRTGRIIGRAWDMMGTLNEGPATEETIAAARAELPKLYRGRASETALVWCRSNRSMRVFETVLDALGRGEQPTVEDLNTVCYLMRNTGLDGNGTFGTRSFPSLATGEHDLGGMLEAQLLLAYLMRELSCDLVEHLAALRSDTAAKLDPALRSYLGVGNGSALGLIFFVQKHPRLLNSWLTARETAIAAALALPLGRNSAEIDALIGLIQRAVLFRQQDTMMYETFAASATVAQEVLSLVPLLEELRDEGTLSGATVPYPLDTLALKAQAEMAPESYETFLSLIMELVPDLADSLAAQVSGADELAVDPAMTAAGMIALLEADYDWALAMDLSAADAQDYVWYKSETAEEPRRGLRAEAPEARDLGLDLPGMLQALHADLAAVPGDQPMALFLLAHPEHRLMVGRAQSLAGSHFHTPHANINSGGFVPIDLVRLMNVALHGIDKTRDYLQRNLRGVLYHGAPTREAIAAGQGGDWFYPEEPRA